MLFLFCLKTECRSFLFRDSLHFVNKQQDFIFLCKLPEYIGDFLSLLEIRKQVLFYFLFLEVAVHPDMAQWDPVTLGAVLLMLAAFVNELVLDINPHLILLRNSAVHVWRKLRIKHKDLHRASTLRTWHMLGLIEQLCYSLTISSVSWARMKEKLLEWYFIFQVKKLNINRVNRHLNQTEWPANTQPTHNKKVLLRCCPVMFTLFKIIYSWRPMSRRWSYRYF